MTLHRFLPLREPVVLESGHHRIVWGDGQNFVLFAGPDVLEDEGLLRETAQEIKKITQRLNIAWVLKCSFDKANRTSHQSFRGLGFQTALKIFEKIKGELDCLILTDVHETWQVDPVSAVVDVIQIPAFLSRQTDLIQAVARTGKVMHIKKGQFMAPWDMKHVVQKALAVGNNKVLLCERGTTFGYQYLINDMTGLVIMRDLGYPVIMDCTHSVQRPSAGVGFSLGERRFISVLARAACAVGVDGLFLETHPNPDEALCDGPSSLPLAELEELLKSCLKIWKTHAF